MGVSKGVPKILGRLGRAALKWDRVWSSRTTPPTGVTAVNLVALGQAVRSRGRQRNRWTEDITDWTGLQINTTVRVTKNRHRWHHVMLTANPLGGRH